MRPSIMMFILLPRRQPVMKLLMSVGSASCFEARDLLGPVFPVNNREKNRGRPERARVPPHPTHGFLFLRLLFTGAAGARKRPRGHERGSGMRRRKKPAAVSPGLQTQS
jgi:hypothetical protein